MIRYGVSLFLVILGANRILFGLEEYKRLSLERETDIYMYDMCNTIDYRKIGRHASLCVDLEHRLMSGVLHHTLKYVVDDTLYRETTLQGIAQLGLVIVLLLVGSGVYHRYTKVLELPTCKKV